MPRRRRLRRRREGPPKSESHCGGEPPGRRPLDIASQRQGRAARLAMQAAMPAASVAMHRGFQSARCSSPRLRSHSASRRNPSSIDTRGS
jgi:hypothetical protein